MFTYKYVFLMWFCFFSTKAYSQINGLAYDIVTNKGIPYTTIMANDSLLLVCSDSNGVFCIDTEHSKLINYLTIQSAGYKPRKVPVGESHLKVALEPIQSDTLKTKASKDIVFKGKIKKIGVPKIKLINPVLGSRAYQNTEIALLIENKTSKTGLLQSISFLIRSLGIFNAPFRLRFYKNNGGVIGQELVIDTIILTAYQKDDWNTFDLSNYKIDFPTEGYFVAIEWLNIGCSNYYYELDNKEKGVGMTIGLTNSVTDFVSYKRYNHATWEKNEHIFWNGFRLSGYHPMMNIDVLF